jgi:hypothetical protein
MSPLSGRFIKPRGKWGQLRVVRRSFITRISGLVHCYRGPGSLLLLFLALLCLVSIGLVFQLAVESRP